METRDDKIIFIENQIGSLAWGFWRDVSDDDVNMMYRYCQHAKTALKGRTLTELDDNRIRYAAARS